MWKKIKSDTIFKHSRLTLTEDVVLLPTHKKIKYLRILETVKASVTILCIKDNCILLQREYSYPCDKILYQFPGGAVEDSESPIEAARREALEESGLLVKKLQDIGWYYTNNRRSDHKMYVYVAYETILAPKNSTGDDEEKITSQWVPIEKIPDMIKNDEIVNYSILAAWSLFKSKCHILKKRN